MALSSQDGRVIAKIGTCGDADDVFVDAKRRRVYVSCGEGAVDVFEQRGRLWACCAGADGIWSAHLAVRPRARPALCRRAGEVGQARGNLGLPSGLMKATRAVAALVPAAVLACWCGSAQAYRPFDGTDAAVAAPGEVEIELGPVEYLREGSERVLFAPDVRFNYGFAQDWEAGLEGELAHGLTAGRSGASLVGNGAFLQAVLREGSLQEKAGPSIATEFEVLLPGSMTSAAPARALPASSRSSGAG